MFFCSTDKTEKGLIMVSSLKWLRKRIFGISLQEATFAKRGFLEGDAGLRQRLEQIGQIFLLGYQAALNDDRPEGLVRQLNAIEIELRGFAFEGAAMGLALLDGLTPWKRNRVQSFLKGAGSEYAYMVYVGVGWALARLPWGIEWYLAQLNKTWGMEGEIDPVLGWLVLDGYGFHQGYFGWQRHIQEMAVPPRLSGYACRVFDQGLGRSLWFVKGADVRRIHHAIENFSPSRRADLWSGVGLACAYAGGVERAVIEALQVAAQPYWSELSQGAAFAAKSRQRAGNLTAHTEVACQVLCAMSAEAAAGITDRMLEDLHPDGANPAYEVWRRRIQAQFVAVQVNP
ncbi:MAG: DUF1702 family protein [Rhizobium sp.]|nr:DUF1702 family protein [Rhizobium sp.]